MQTESVLQTKNRSGPAKNRFSVALGEKTDWVGKKLTSQFFPPGKEWASLVSPGEKTDWGEIPACYTGIYFDFKLFLKFDCFTEWEK